MDDVQETTVTRKEIDIRFLYSLLYIVVFEILKFIIQITVLFQFIYLFIWREYSDPLRRFSNKVATYAYKVIRYLTLTDNIRPFPFSDFPDEMEKVEETVNFK